MGMRTWFDESEQADDKAKEARVEWNQIAERLRYGYWARSEQKPQNVYEWACTLDGSKVSGMRLEEDHAFIEDACAVSAAATGPHPTVRVWFHNDFGCHYEMTLFVGQPRIHIRGDDCTGPRDVEAVLTPDGFALQLTDLSQGPHRE